MDRDWSGPSRIFIPQAIQSSLLDSVSHSNTACLLPGSLLGAHSHLGGLFPRGGVKETEAQRGLVTRLRAPS